MFKRVIIWKLSFCFTHCHFFSVYISNQIFNNETKTLPDNEVE